MQENTSYSINLLSINSNLNTKKLGKNIKYFDEVSSTNIIAKDLASKESSDGTLIISKTQTSGKGRLNRSWISPEGGIWASLILKPNFFPLHASKITILAASALAITLKNHNLDIKIKWPNDLLLNNKKICGILTEMKCVNNKINYIILGFGINVNIVSEDIPTELKNKCTSLFLETENKFNVNELLCEFLQNFESLYFEFLQSYCIDTALKIYRENSSVINKKIIISSNSKYEEVFCKNITADGGLIIIDTDSNERILFSGDVTLSSNYASK